MKKKVIACILCTLIFVLSGPLSAWAAGYYSYEKLVVLTIGEKKAKINDTECLLDAEAYVKSGRTLVPLRFLSEAIGAEVNWDSNAKTAKVTIDGIDIKVKVNSRTAMYDDIQITLDVPAEIKNGRVFVPLRFFAEQTGAYISYDAPTKTITMVAVNETGWNKLDDYWIYPPDWKGEITEDQIIHYTSPLGSEVWVQSTSEELEKVISSMKTGAEKSGFVFQKEELLKAGIPDLGKVLLFVELDDNGNLVAIYQISIEQTEESVVVKEIYTPLEAYDYDMPVISTVLDQYYG